MKQPRPNNRAPNDGLSQEVTIPVRDGARFPLLAWQGSHRLVTVVGDVIPRMFGFGVANALEVGAVLRYRAGGFEFEDRWPFMNPGFRRTIACDQLTLSVRRSLVSGAGAAPTEVIAAASLDLGAAQEDRLVQLLWAAVAEQSGGGFARPCARFPHGTKEIRVWHPSPHGLFHLARVEKWPDDFGNDLSSADFPTFIVVQDLTVDDLADWTPVGIANAIFYSADGTTGSYDTGSSSFGDVCWLESRA